VGVLTQQDFGIFQDHGYKGLKKGHRILDYMGTDELAANLLRASQTEQKLRNAPTITDKDRANDAHHKLAPLCGSSSSSRATHRRKDCRRQQRVSPSYNDVSGSVSWRRNRPIASPRSLVKTAPKQITPSDTPHGPRPGGFSGYACGNPLRSRLKAVSPPTVRMPDPGNKRLASRTLLSSHPHARKRQ
jgi:hypothetical protein